MSKERFIALADIHSVTDYSNRSSVRHANSAADEMRVIIQKAALSGAEEIDSLLELLSHPTAGSWVAYSALDIAPLTEFQKARCLAVVRKRATLAGIEGLGAQTWLKDHGFSV